MKAAQAVQAVGLGHRYTASLLARSVRELGISLASSVLMLGADTDDVEMMHALGFNNLTTSNIDGFGGHLALDAEHIDLPDNSYDIVFAHAVLHHCRSPHAAVLEGCRVARSCMVFLEGNDSLMMRALIRLGMHNPYEVPAVIAHDYKAGGVRNSALPNFVYRWSLSTLRQTVCAGFPERLWPIRAHRFFELSATEVDLALRRDGLGKLAATVGARRLLRAIRAFERLANYSPLASQGNHFLAIIQKGDLHPWIEV